MSTTKLTAASHEEGSGGPPWSLARPARYAALWFGLALLGQAATLQLIDAGPALHYQHYKSLSRIVADKDTLLLAFIGLQAVVVALALMRRWGAIWVWLRRSFRLWQLGAIGLVFYLPVAAVSERVSFYIGEFLFAVFLQTLNLATVVLAAWSLPASTVAAIGEKSERLVGPPGIAPTRIDRFALMAAAWVMLLAGALSFFVYQRHPHVTDEVAYLLHARFLASGHLTMPAPPVPEAFDLYLMETDGDRWFPATAPGWPAVLAVGVRLGVPWLVNPVLGGLSVLLTYLLLQELYDRRIARIAVLLLCASPWFIFMAMNFMTHTFTLTCALGAALAVARSRATGKAAWGLAAGILVGIGTIIRPLDGLIVGLLLGLWALGLGGKRLRVAAIAAFAAGTALAGALVLPYNRALTGSVTTFPMNAYVDEHFGPGRNDYGFGPNRGFGWPLDPNPGHGPVDALINANLNSFSLNTELFGWSTGSLLLAAVAIFAGPRRKGDALMAAVIAAVFVALFFYYYSGGPDFGPRYWYLMIVPCVALTVRGMQALGTRTDSARVTVAVGMLCLMALVNYFPWRALDKYHYFWGMRPDVRDMAAQYDFGRSLVLVHGDSHPDYASAAIYNPLDLRAAAPVYAWDKDPEVRAAAIRAYADRPVWIVDGPTVTGDSYRVAAGPLSPTEALAR